MKPYDPAHDSDALRAKLRELPGYKISPASLLYRVTKFAEANNLPRPDISRITLERFREGESSKKLEALATIWAYFESEPMHTKLIASSGASDPVAEEHTPSAINDGMRSYYSLEPHAYTPFSLNECAFQFVGYYLMYRRDWLSAGKISLSILAIEGKTDRVAEMTNAFGPDQNRVYYLSNEGFVFNRGQFLHFLLRQAAGPGLLFGTIDSFTPFSSFEPVTRMTGVLTGTTHDAVIPNTRFYCQRVKMGGEPATGLFDPSEIDSEEALRYLSEEGS